MPIKHVMVTGAHRSGTSYVGRVITKSRGYTYLTEPCNHQWGIEGINHFYPYPSDYYKNLMDDFFRGNFKYKQGVYENPVVNIFTKLVGNKLSMTGTYYKYFGKRYTRMLLKDPLGAYLSDYLHDRHDVSVLVLIRHPMAFSVSQKRMGWRTDFSQLLSQTDLIKSYLSEEREMMAGNLTYDEENGLIWRCLYKVLHDYNTKNRTSDRWLCVRHEDLCLDPLPCFEKIVRFLGLTMNDKMRRFIVKTTSGATVQPENREYLHFARDSRRLAYSWKDRVTQKETDVIRSITEDIARHYYDDDSWER